MWQKKWVFGNWKMNGRLQNNDSLLHALAHLPPAEHTHIGIAVPHLYLHRAAQALSGSPIWAGAQDVSRFHNDGAYTGENSAAMAADVGGRFALVGHSERRSYFGENNALLAEKIRHCLAAGLVPVLCVGETLAERENGTAEAVVAHQLSILKEIPQENIAVAYEPVWAIGTGRVASVAQITAMHTFIHQEILSSCGSAATIRVLYGGSVNAANAADILAAEAVDGALVGGASLQADSFAAIIRAAETPREHGSL